ncbi:hypothetical protein K5I29_05765 [Flavobacterium agricola]|uniref:Exosortase/archaeosortase family protein n=1 Tax=Flavobacterium agricola TaxID=2870839 RepID=A0ABY6M1T8_9FLAO|nr:hypothetical protein [Flavobacterium agricola]UYW02401.1 hypothetical protein K5I29_05765 [Flavobacterium agricola]
MSELTKYKLKQKVDFEFPDIVSLAKKKLIQVWFGCATLLFFFNFFTISCDGNQLVALSGLNLVTGTNVAAEITNNLTEIKGLKAFDEKGNIVQADAVFITDEKGRVSPNFFGIISFTCTLFPLFLYFLKTYYINRIATILGLIAFISLLILRLSFIGNLVLNTKEMLDLFIETSWAFWFTLLFLALGTFFSFVRWDIE